MILSGRLSEKRLCACVVILVIAASTLAAAAKSVPVTVTVNGKPYTGWHMEHGTVVGPLELFAHAIGLDAGWNSSHKALSIKAASPWVEVPPPIGENNHPYDLAALGPIMAVRRTLDDEQFSSLQQWKNESTPVLVRYEIVNAYNMDSAVLGRDGLTEADATSYLVDAVLYWAFFKPSPGMTPGTVRIVYGVIPGGYETVFEGLKVLHGRIDTVELTVDPQDAKLLNPTELQKNGLAGKEALLSGTGGWNVTDRSITSTRSVKTTTGPGGIPIYDLSVEKLIPPKDVDQHQRTTLKNGLKKGK
jgi:hypothetical protein